MSVAAASALRAAIAALQARRAELGDTVLELALAPLHEQLAALQPRPAHLLCLDVVGSTRLGRQLDAEDLHLLIDGALQRFTGCVRHHGGRVLQYAGDSLLALWAAEPEAERAVRAGLALLAEARAVAAGQPGFAVRVGLHSSALLPGDIDEGALAEALRMERLAPPGRLRVSDATWQHVREAFEFEDEDTVPDQGRVVRA